MDVDASSMASARLIIGGMSCASCAASVESVLQVPPPSIPSPSRLPAALGLPAYHTPAHLLVLQAMVGVESATVNFAVGKATVRFDTSEVSVPSISMPEGGESILGACLQLCSCPCHQLSRSVASLAYRWGSVAWWRQSRQQVTRQSQNPGI